MSTEVIKNDSDTRFNSNNSETSEEIKKNGVQTAANAVSIYSRSAHTKVKKIKLFRNGDRFYRGMTYAVSSDRYKALDSLLADLTRSPVCDKNVLPMGVRYLFALDGNGRVESLEDLLDGEAYVCSSTNSYFSKIQYQASEIPVWNASNVYASHSFFNSSLPSSPIVSRRSHVQCHFKTMSRDPSIIESLDENDTDFVRPKLITVFRNGPKPRRAAKVLLNKKTAHSLEQVMEEINQSIKLDSGAVKKIFNIKGKQMTSLPEFFGDDTIYFAFGHEKPSADNFVLTPTEMQFVSATSRLMKQQHVTLKSPLLNKKSWMSPSDKNLNRSENHSSEELHQSQSPTANQMMKKRPTTSNGHSLPGGQGLQTQDGQPTLLRVKYKVGRVIGEGKFAVVRECVEKARKLPFALKMINKMKVRDDYEALKNEVAILRKVKHENIIELVEEFETATHHYLIFELVNGGDLFELISQMSNYCERDASSMVGDISKGTSYLHGLNIVHRDIKPENILVHIAKSGQRVLKLADMGLAAYATDPLFTVCGTPTYVAPEVIAEVGYGLKVDIWSIGVLTYILLCGFPPFSSDLDDQDELFDKILDGKFEFVSPYWDDVSRQAKELIESMLSLDVSKRPTAEDLASNPWILDPSVKQKFNQSVSSKIVEFTKQNKSHDVCSTMANTALDKDTRYFEGRKQNHCDLQKPEDHTEPDGSTGLDDSAKSDDPVMVEDSGEPTYF